MMVTRARTSMFQATRQLRGLGYEPGGADGPQKVSAFVNAESKKWGDLIRAAGITAD